MIELPEAVTLARQMSETLPGKTIESVVVLQSPHKWAWFHGEPAEYPAKLRGRTVSGAEAFGGMVELSLGPLSLAVYDGPNVRYATDESELPAKHQLLLRFDDGTFLVGSVQMYGGFACFEAGTYDNRYYLAARQAPSPLGEAFTLAHLQELLARVDRARLTAKLFLATEQRIPGLGNGVLQDILYNAGVHPRRRMDSLDREALSRLHEAIVRTLAAMTELGGRDTERDLFGHAGLYRTLMSKNTVGSPCLACGTAIQKAAYAGGSVYFCPRCQPA